MSKNKFVQPKISPWQKIILIIAGLFLSLFLLEIGLRIGGFIFSSLQEYRNRVSFYRKGTYRIMCLGESVTAVGNENSYPSQLENVLKQRNISIKFSVINKGVVGSSSSYILAHLEENLNRYRPDMVTIMTGINDENIKYYENIPDANTVLFNKLRIYRFSKIIWMHILNKIGRSGIAKANEGKSGTKLNSHLLTVELKERAVPQPNPTLAEESFKKAIEINPQNDNAYVSLGAYYQTQLNLTLAEESFKKAIEINPQNDNAYVSLGLYYHMQAKFILAEESFKKAIEINPQNDNAYVSLALLYQQMGKDESAREYYKKAEELRWEDYYNSITGYNYQKIKEILDKRGIKLVCLQYPVRSIEPLKKIFEDEKGVIFVDNERIFKDALKKASYKEYFTDMFGGDFGHCTRKGNRLLAENIANVILKEVFGK